jgi:hypothetical protein
VLAVIVNIEQPHRSASISVLLLHSLGCKTPLPFIVGTSIVAPARA